MSRRRSVAALAALLILAAMPAVAAPALARNPAQGAHERIVAHWTNARMKAAQPRDFVRNAHGTFRPAAKPPRPGAGGGVVGAPWPNGQGLVYRAVGKVFFDMAGDSWVCSGSVVNDGGATGYSLVLTAAHCAYDEAADEFATNWMFIPQFDSAPTFTCGQTAFGCWTATPSNGGGLVVHDGYSSRESFDAPATWHDFAIARVGPGGKAGVNPDLDRAINGSFPITFSAFNAGTQMSAFGYPAAGKYKGRDLTYCAGPVAFDPQNDNRTYAMACEMTGGSSGGGWFSGFSDAAGSGTLGSLNSYGYSGVKNMYGPKFGAPTSLVYSRAASGSGNASVP